MYVDSHECFSIFRNATLDADGALVIRGNKSWVRVIVKAESVNLSGPAARIIVGRSNLRLVIHHRH